MKRNEFKKIIEIRSAWKVGKGNYSLPSGDRIRDYIFGLVESQLKLDSLVIAKNGDIYAGSLGCWDTEKREFTDYVAFAEENESCSYDEQERRINDLVKEIIG